MQIRPALDQDEDYDAYCRLLSGLDALHSQAQPRYYRFPGLPARPRDFYRSLCGGDDSGLLFALEDAQAVGLLSFDVQAFAHPVVVPRRILYINDMVVEPGHRRHGVGRALMAAAQAWAAAHGCSDLRLAVSEFNAEAREFYLALGFQVQTRMMVQSVE